MTKEGQPTALTRATPAQVAVAPSGPDPSVRRAVPAMLEAAADAFGDLVHTLLHDLDEVTAAVESLGWLALTPSLLDREPAFIKAAQQMKMWESFIAALPNPHLFSERGLEERRRLERLHVRARVLGRERALADHRRLLEAEARTADAGTALALRRGAEDPEAVGWRVNPHDYVQAELARLPPLPPYVPIRAADLHPAQNAAGHQAVLGMRAHPVLSGQARALDEALARVLARDFVLKTPEARAHAEALTGIFLVALMRALRAGDMELATSVRFVVPADARRISAAFGEELLRSWVAHVETLPPRPERQSLAARVRGWLGASGRTEEASPVPAPRRLTGPDQDG